MRITRLFGIIVIALALAACGGDGLDTVDEAVDSLPSEDETTGAVADIQEEINTLTTEIASSEAADTLQAAWADLESEISVALSSISADEPIDTEAVRAELDEFGAEVEQAGDAVSDELRSAWETLRTEFEQLMS